MNCSELIEKLAKLADYSIIFTRHAELRLVQRQIDKKTVLNHLRSPFFLKLFEELPAQRHEEKYKLWFVPFKRTAYVYVIVLNHFSQRIIVKTVIKQRLEWQKRVEKNVKQI